MDTQSNQKQCSICKGVLVFIGTVPIRTGGGDGFGQIFFQNIQALDETLLPIDMFRCKNCGHLEMFDLDFSLPV